MDYNKEPQVSARGAERIPGQAGGVNSSVADASSRSLRSPGQARGVNSRPPVSARMRTTVLIITGIVALLIYISTFALMNLTLMPWWLPWAVGVPLGLAAGLWCGGWWSRYVWPGHRAAGVAVHAVLVAGVAAFGLVMFNSAGLGDRQPERRTVRLVEVNRYERHHTRRVGRNRYVQGEAYHVYEATVEIDGREKSLPVEYMMYSRCRRRRPDSLRVDVRRGRLGYDVVESSSLGFK